MLLDFLSTCQKRQEIHQDPSCIHAMSSDLQCGNEQLVRKQPTQFVSQADMKPYDQESLQFRRVGRGEELRADTCIYRPSNRGPKSAVQTQSSVVDATVLDEDATVVSSAVLLAETPLEQRLQQAPTCKPVGEVVHDNDDDADDDDAVAVADPDPHLPGWTQRPTKQFQAPPLASVACCGTSQSASQLADMDPPSISCHTSASREVAREMPRGPLTFSTEVDSASCELDVISDQTPAPHQGFARVRPPLSRSSDRLGKARAAAVDRGVMAPAPPLVKGAEAPLARFRGRTLGGA